MRRLFSCGWIVTLLLAGGFVLVSSHPRVERVERLTELALDPPAPDSGSPTGYAGGARRLLVPDQNSESYQWIAQTQRMVAHGEWRLRQVDYDNAPAGRAVYSPSLYRWWLAGVAAIHEAIGGGPFGAAVERAALWADPILLLVFLAAGTLLVAARFGALAAAVFPLAAAAAYPFAGVFQPGAPDDVGLGLVLPTLAALGLLGGIDRFTGPVCSRRWFVGAGVLGGLALWANVSVAVPLLVGQLLGAGATVALLRRTGGVLPWRAWSVAGALTTVAAWLIEYAPGHLDLSAARLSEVHPWYALAWAGAGEILRWASLRAVGSAAPRRADWIRLAIAIAAVAVLPITLLLGDAPGFLLKDTFAYRLVAIDPVEAPDLLTWLATEHRALRLVAVFLPLSLLPFAAWRWLRRDTDPARRLALGVALGPVVVAAGFGLGQLSWWAAVSAGSLLLLVLLLGPRHESSTAARWPAWTAALLALVMLPGALVLARPAEPAEEEDLTRAEQEALLERDVAHWLARRAGPDGAVVLAPPRLTVSAFFHGGLRGLGSPYRENEDGFRGSIRLAGATSADEAHALARQRQLTHILIPSWDAFLDEYARLGTHHPENTLMGLLHRWLPPRWLRPVPYYLPNNPELAGERLVVYEVGEVQEPAAALSRLAEYFVDMGQVELAALVARALASEYAGDLGAQVAKARTEIARRDASGFSESLRAIRAGLAAGADELLPWDRRVSLCLVLAEGNQAAQARTQAERCLEVMGEEELRSLSEPTLFRFLTLCRALELELGGDALVAYARQLLPPTLRDQI